MAHLTAVVLEQLNENLERLRQSIVQEWDSRCLADHLLKDLDRPDGNVTVNALVQSIAAPPTMEGGPSSDLATAIQCLSDENTRMLFATRCLLHMREAIESLLFNGIKSEDRCEMQVRLSLAISWSISSVASAKLRRVDEEAYRDRLTSLLNKRAFARDLEREVERAGGSGKLSMVNIDLNGLKAVNDSKGHEAGDALITRFGALLSTNLPTGNFAYRWGGDEFAALLPGQDKATTERLFETLAHSEIPSFSWGVATLNEDPGDHVAIAALADQRMYEMKDMFKRRKMGFLWYHAARLAKKYGLCGR